MFPRSFTKNSEDYILYDADSILKSSCRQESSSSDIN